MADPSSSSPKLTTSSPEVQAFMAEAAAALKQDLCPPKDVFSFGDNARLTNVLLGFALAGTKTTTTTWPIPDPLYWGVGDLSVSLDGDGKPAMVMRTVDLRRRKFLEVDEKHARDEGEDDGSLAMWRQEHRKYYSRQNEATEFNDEVEVLCERFEVIYPIRSEGKA